MCKILVILAYVRFVGAVAVSEAAPVLHQHGSLMEMNEEAFIFV